MRGCSRAVSCHCLAACVLTVLFTSFGFAADEELTREQKLASVHFTRVKWVYVTELVVVNDQRIPAGEPVAVRRGLMLEQPDTDLVLKWISSPDSYSFAGTAACFTPGMRITISEENRTVVLDVCLDCHKMGVMVDQKLDFGMDFSQLGLALYKSIYFDYVVQRKRQVRPLDPGP